MSELFSYLPQDRLAALVRDQVLPDHAQGSVLFADISGFTPLTEALVQTRGVRHGAEELPLYLNRIYSALIAEIDQYAGSVISFAGDAITCWFDETPPGLIGCPPAPHRATACALAMQAAMQGCATIHIPTQAPLQLSIKISVASGPARRFRVGDPQIQVMDVLAGETVSRAAAAEHLAKSGEVLLDEPSVRALDKQLVISEWRESEETHSRCAVIESLALRVEPTPWPTSLSTSLTDESLRFWLLPAV
ncbi:adenylate/guanylate cyclase domain-containing protein, partial [Candidatus Acetothermia bacterium]|nr:adenylate/guanylate cyclase domain-containing protein [Candidatus Acetothermia bacterium]